MFAADALKVVEYKYPVGWGVGAPAISADPQWGQKVGKGAVLL